MDVQEEVTYDNFDPVIYHQQYYTKLDDEVKFFLGELHDIFAPEGILGDERQRVLLELGCGPTIIFIISASLWTSDITMVDPVAANREHVLRWMLNTASSLNWSPFLQHVYQLEMSQTMLNDANDNLFTSQAQINSSEMLARRVRSSVRDVNCVDVNQIPTHLVARYNVVLTSLCLEFACADSEQYRKAVSNVAQMITAAGFLVMQGALGNTFYMVGNRRFKSVRLEKQHIVEALANAAMSVCLWRQMERQSAPHLKPTDHTHCFVVVAQKNADCNDEKDLSSQSRKN